MTLVTGQFSKLYDGSWSFHEILLIFVANLFGVLTLYGVCMISPSLNLIKIG